VSTAVGRAIPIARARAVPPPRVNMAVGRAIPIARAGAMTLVLRLPLCHRLDGFVLLEWFATLLVLLN